MHCTMVEDHQTSWTQAAAPAVAVARQKSFGKTADQMDHSTMGYTWSACIAGSSSNLDMTLESGSLRKQNKFEDMTLVQNSFVQSLKILTTSYENFRTFSVFCRDIFWLRIETTSKNPTAFSKDMKTIIKCSSSTLPNFQF